MDPDTVLAAIRSLVVGIQEWQPGDDDDPASLASELAESVQSLDGWLSRGGFLPTAWRRRD